jgi:hypothetical protein
MRRGVSFVDVKNPFARSVKMVNTSKSNGLKNEMVKLNFKITNKNIAAKSRNNSFLLK